ncbi:MAG: helix-turn-helix domain containing protein [Novosphingobium sp.]
MTSAKRAMPTDARWIRSRKALNAALPALLEERAFDQLTIREITARTSTGYATFFRHYPDKEALLNDVATILHRPAIVPLIGDKVEKRTPAP